MRFIYQSSGAGARGSTCVNNPSSGRLCSLAHTALPDMRKSASDSGSRFLLAWFRSACQRHASDKKLGVPTPVLIGMQGGEAKHRIDVHASNSIRNPLLGLNESTLTSLSARMVAPRRRRQHSLLAQRAARQAAAAGLKEHGEAVVAARVFAQTPLGPSRAAARTARRCTRWHARCVPAAADCLCSMQRPAAADAGRP
jgi:hypothetical protein